jgi:LysR family transcriptional regulator, cys regulon transcriptional activator
MNFQQFRFVRAAVRNDLNLTEVASALYTSQSGVSKQIKDLESELGIELFVRKGKRLTGLTKAGHSALQMIERILLETENLRRYADQYHEQESGRLVIATTHNQAIYTLPGAVQKFMKLYPKVNIELRQGTPKYVTQTVINGIADFAIATEGMDQHAELITYPCFSWRHVVVVPRGHALTKKNNITLADVAQYPIITYNHEFTGRTSISSAFVQAGLTPDVRLTAIDADVIKTYVDLGLGVGIVAEIAMRDGKYPNLVTVAEDVKFFEPCTTKIAIRRGTLLHSYAYRFIEMVAPELKEAELRKTANPA